MLVRNPIKALRNSDGRAHKANAKRADYDNILAIAKNKNSQPRRPERLIFVGVEQIELDEALVNSIGPLG